jgi:hypothetical protein
MIGTKAFYSDIGGKTVVAQCHEVLAVQAQWLLDYLKKKFALESDKLVDGFKIQVGWSILCLLERDSEFILAEPNYQENPFQDWRDNITDTLTVQAQQNHILQLLGIQESSPALFQDKITFAKGAFFERQIRLERGLNPQPGDSGWYCGPVTASKDNPAYEAIYVYQLIHHRPALLQLLSLPHGFSAVVDGNDVIRIEGPGGKVWNL